jgi:hypothetical protein
MKDGTSTSEMKNIGRKIKSGFNERKEEIIAIQDTNINVTILGIKDLLLFNLSPPQFNCY